MFTMILITPNVAYFYIIEEIFRWNIILPLQAPHQLLWMMTMIGSPLLI